MFRLAWLFLVSASVSAFCGFGWFLDLSFLAGRVLCGLFLLLAALAFAAGLSDRGPFGDSGLQRS